MHPRSPEPLPVAVPCFPEAGSGLWSYAGSRNVEAAAPRLQGAEVKPEPPAWAGRCRPTAEAPAKDLSCVSLFKDYLSF